MVKKYSGVAIALHWIIAVGVFTNLVLPNIWEAMGDENVRPLINTHKSIGVTVLGLAVMRLLWRLTHTPPALPASYKPWEVKTSHAAHWALYAFMFAMPLTGWIMDSAWKDAATHPMSWFGLFEWPRIGMVMTLDPVTKEAWHGAFGAAHEILGYALWALWALHVGAAFKHQFMDGEKEIQRMMP
ncbi:MAG: cytochrome b [Novosphingobium sp.]|uniref:cytochrome b n=1 Tax=Novosphingobium sp. TaxID=1874826 RepID=UPI0030183680